MDDHYQTALQSQQFIGKYFFPKYQKVTHRLKDVNRLVSLADSYDLIILDRDCTLHGYHAGGREKRFEDTLRSLKGKSELVSNSSYDEFLNIGRIFSRIVPVSKVVQLDKWPDAYHVIRIDNHFMRVYKYNPWAKEEHPDRSDIKEVTIEVLHDLSSQKFRQEYSIAYHLKKPDPKIIEIVQKVNIHINRIPENPRTLMVGDRYLTDIVCGNLAKVDTAKVYPYRPFSDTPVLQLTRILDVILGQLGRLSRQ